MAGFLKRVSECEAAMQLLNGWGLRLSPQPIPLEARQLAPETIFFGKGRRCVEDKRSEKKRYLIGFFFREMVTPKADWGRTATGSPCLTPVPLKKWAVLFVDKSKVQVQNFCKIIQQQGPRMGIDIAMPKVGGEKISIFFAIACNLLYFHSPSPSRTTARTPTSRASAT